MALIIAHLNAGVNDSGSDSRRLAIGSSSSLPGLSNKPQVMVSAVVDVRRHVYSVTSSDVHLKRVSSAGMEFAVSVLKLHPLVYDVLSSFSHCRIELHGHRSQKTVS